MNIERSAGVLLHPTSLPGKFGIGDLGPEAYNFIQYLEACGQTLWEVLPLGPTGYGDSPYQCFSAFAGNPLLISPEKLVEEGLLTPEDISRIPSFNAHSVEFGEVIDFKKTLLVKAFNKFENSQNKGLTLKFEVFCEHNAYWLNDYALFMTIKEAHHQEHWNTWNKSLIQRAPGAIESFTANHKREIEQNKFIQFLFSSQWNAVKEFANKRGIKIIGDLPIFVAYDSADAWANKQLFDIDDDGQLVTKAGVPPDYFSKTGQMWGNPLYRWDEMEVDDFAWWRMRIKQLLEMVDIIRVDHFRGFEAYWEIPGDALTAESGKWIKAPGLKLFAALQKHLGQLPILAEDLGLITKDVIRLRDHFNFPGMKILQFAFGSKMDHKFLPHNYTPNCVVYTGSHDNDTTRGYFERAKTEPNDIYSSVQKYLNYYGDDIVLPLIRLAYSTVAKIVIIPMQDMLNVGTEGRMNFPGKLGGNWAWRFSWDQVQSNTPAIFKEFVDIYDRKPKEEGQEPHESKA